MRSNNKIKYIIGKTNEEEIWKIEFEMSIKRSLKERIDNSFIKTYKPIIDDKTYRIFDKMEDYRQWCEKNLYLWLGYGK